MSHSDNNPSIEDMPTKGKEKNNTEIVKLSQFLDSCTSFHKPLMIQFYADWYLPCKQMDKLVLTDSEVQNLLHQFIIWNLDGETSYGSDIRMIYNITSYPNYLVIDNLGNVLSTQSGTCDVSTFIHFLESGKTKYYSN